MFTFHGLEEVASGALDHTCHLLPTKPASLAEKWHERKEMLDYSLEKENND